MSPYLTIKISPSSLPSVVPSPTDEAGPHGTSQVFEERQKRLLSEVEAERHDGCERLQRLRQELRRVEQEWHQGGTRGARWG